MTCDTRKMILKDVFYEECEVIGYENLDKILENKWVPVQTEFGEDMPLLEFVGVVVAAVGFIDASRSLYDRVKLGKNANDLKLESYVSLARSELDIPVEIGDDRIEKIFQMIINK